MGSAPSAKLAFTIIAGLHGTAPVDRAVRSVHGPFFDEQEVPMILEHHRLIDESEVDAIYARMSEAKAESVLSGYVKRAYFDYRKANKFLH
jgi:hypothetical protein